ncbi:MAG: hypothetical protein MN733_37120, partial [Nitrososphaera sp.]|nr:hypothetical protein [Nitrososphaera sp.]
VGKFLPINLAEMALMVRRIVREVASPKTVRFLLVAFQAHLTRDFHCLEKAALDIVNGAEVGGAVATCEVKKLLRWLEGKKRYESEVLIQGLEEMVVAVRLYPANYPPLFLSALNQALQSLKHVKELRASCSDEGRIDGEYRKYVEHLEGAIHELRGISDGAKPDS